MQQDSNEHTDSLTSDTLGHESLGGGSSRLERSADGVKEAARETADSARDRAAHLKSSLADKLEHGAEKLRHKSASTGITDTATEAERKARKASDKVASGMESTADWIRNADVDSVKSGLEHQVRSNPGRTLLVALGLGYVVGRIFRGGRGS
jgi:hypothetical protein